MSLRRFFAGLLLAGLASAASAADKRITLDGGDTFSIKWSEGWVVGDRLPNSPFGALTLHGADPALWRMTLSPLPPHPTLTGDIGNLRIYVRSMARGIENGGAEVEPEHKPIDGTYARGFYFKAHDSRPVPKARAKAQGGAYTDAYVGALSINSKPYLFEVVWNKGGEAAANTGLTALKTVRIQ